ncbi:MULTISPECIES: hypothetical protein [unclassified Streptomyces]|uniref:hypothetical protein n=1 Tax=unclassified Streptomyces TaxID=2593676 RepID=UPI0006B06C09|nr:MULTISPECIES: hypothetical protein [unclassified Streptomyces]KOX24458.1 hypothetical protein ADL06_21545 [Streptomyces sp. NRRL F-6491]KOX43366.1 hypothetical protein ADL08_15085 [Streptomyces sp. NRRL F-6492]
MRRNGFPITPENLPEALAESVARINGAVLDAYSVVFRCAAGLMLLAGLLAGALITMGPRER